MRQEQPVYIVVTHTKKAPKKAKEAKIYERVFLSDTLTKNRQDNASLIIDVKERSIVKASPKYDEIGHAAVINHYIGNYLDQIAKFYMKEYGIVVEGVASEI